MDRIAIIGAGVSGLMMAKLLMEKGYNVQIFEAQNYIGGRVKGDSFLDIPIDLGAQWLHQIENKPNVLTQILTEKNISLVEDAKDEALVVDGNTCYNETPKIVEDFFDYLSTQQFVEDQSLAITISNFSQDPFLKQYLEAYVSDMATSTATMSTKKFLELGQGFLPDDYQLKDMTMSHFIETYFTDSLKDVIRLNTPIVAINYTKNGVELESLNNELFEFDKCIISVPISQLQQNKIMFSPDLPAHKIEAFNKIGMGKGLKVILFFKEAILLHAYFNATYAPYYVPVVYDHNKQAAIITLLMGNYAEEYEQNPKETIKNIVNEIGVLFGKDVDSLFMDVIVQDWSKETYIEGTYSFALVGEENAREISKEPVDDVLFFIGEAMNTNHVNGFIHGAMDTAVELAERF